MNFLLSWYFLIPLFLVAAFFAYVGRTRRLPRLWTATGAVRRMSWVDFQEKYAIPLALILLFVGWWVVTRRSEAQWAVPQVVKQMQFWVSILYLVLIAGYLLPLPHPFEKRFIRRLALGVAVLTGIPLAIWTVSPRGRNVWAAYTVPTLLPHGDFPEAIAPRFVPSDCQKDPPDAIAMRVDTISLIQPSRVVRNPQGDYWDVLWTGNESAGFAVLTNDLKRELLVLYPNARQFHSRLEVFGGLLNHFDIRNVEFQRRPDGPWVHETVSLDFGRSYDPNTGYWYCEYPPSGGYPNPQLMSLMGPGQSALVLGSVTNPTAFRTFDEVVRDHRGIVEFDFELDEQAYLYFMHWDHRYVGWFGHQVRFKLFVEPVL